MDEDHPDKQQNVRRPLEESLELRPAVDSKIVDEFLVMTDGHVQSRLPLRDPGLRAALTLLTDGRTTEDALFAAATSHGGDGSAMSLPLVLRRLESGGWISFRACDANGRVVTAADPRGHALEVTSRRVVSTSVLEVSDHALVRQIDGRITAESPLTGWDLTIVDLSWLEVLLSFDGTTSVGDVASTHHRLSADVATIANLAVKSGLVRFADEPPTPGLEMWSLPDLWFHSMSRVGVHRGGYGGTYFREGTVEPEPAIRPRIVSDSSLWSAFDDFDPDCAGLEDPPLSSVVQRRRSIREHDESKPICREQLGELLGRVGAVRTTVHDGHQELSFRQVPSGGALHELELYPLIHNCTGIEPGLHHYDAGDHGLELIRAADPSTRLLLEYAQRTSTMTTPPQVSIFVAARFGRAMWKYESMAYALVLKHVGVLYEALYLTATAMGLACCALGGGNSHAFAEASGLPMHVEGLVGEFIVGSRPSSEHEVEMPGQV